jgi:flagellar basal body rod protein FlgC
MANAETARTPDGGADRSATFQATFQAEMATGVSIADVGFPNLNPAEEMVNLMNAQRSYEATSPPCGWLMT